MAFANEKVQLKKVKDASVHEGMLETARYIKTKLVDGDNEGSKPILEIAREKLEAAVGKDKAKVSPG